MTASVSLRPTLAAPVLLLACLLSGSAQAQFGVAIDELGRTVVPLQITRAFPLASLRGELLLSTPPEALLNGQAARLAPGARIWGPDGQLMMWNMALGRRLKVNYTRDSMGLLMDLWILRPDELARHWPKSEQEAALLTFDPVGKAWVKP